MTVPRVLLLVLALLHAAGLDEVLRRATCAELCKRDGCANDCSPDEGCLVRCHCSTSLTAPPPAEVIEAIDPSLRSTAVTFDRGERMHPCPDPNEILHVPRPALG